MSINYAQMILSFHCPLREGDGVLEETGNGERTDTTSHKHPTTYDSPMYPGLKTI